MTSVRAVQSSPLRRWRGAGPACDSAAVMPASPPGTARWGADRAGAVVLLLRRLAVVALLPFRHDALIVLGRPIEIVLDHVLHRLVRVELDRLGELGTTDHGIIFAIELHGVLAERPIRKDLGGFEVLGRLQDGDAVGLPTQ